MEDAVGCTSGDDTSYSVEDATYTDKMRLIRTSWLVQVTGRRSVSRSGSASGGTLLGGLVDLFRSHQNDCLHFDRPASLYGQCNRSGSQVICYINHYVGVYISEREIEAVHLPAYRGQQFINYLTS